MARIKIDLPKEFNFSTEMEVTIDSINYGGHLSNDKILAMAHEARLRYLKHIGATELDFFGVSLIMGDTAIVYKSEGFHLDKIKIEVTAGDISRVGFDLFYKFHNLTSGKELAHVKTGMVCFDYKERKVKEMPERFKQVI